MADTDRIKRNLGKMIDQGAPETDIDAYLKTEGFNSPDEWRAAIAPAAKAGPQVRSAAMAVQQRPPQVEPGPPTGTMPRPSMPWGDVGMNALANAPSSAWEFAKATAQPFIDPVGTGRALHSVVRGLEAPMEMVKVTLPNGQTVWQPQPTPETEGARAARTAPANAVGDFFANRYGSMEGFKNALATDPVGVLADASAVLTAGGTLPVRGAGVLSKAGAIVDPLTQTGNALKLAGRGVGETVAAVTGGTTGAGGSSVKAAARAGREGGTTGQAFRENMRGDVPAKDTVVRAKEALDSIRADRGKEYRSGMVDISKDRTILDFDGINESLDKAGGVGKFKGANIEPAAQEINEQLRKTVKDWETLNPKSPLFKDVAPGDLTAANFHTPEGLDALKRTLGNLRDSTDPHTPAGVAANRVYNAVKAEIVKQAPAYAKVMEAYETASDQISEVSRTFSLGKKASDDTAARKLQSVTRNNVQTNYGERKRLLDVLAEQEPTLPYAIAGQAMNALAPRGIVARGGAMGGALAGGLTLNPWMIPAIPAFSPRFVGETAYLGGRAGAGLDAIGNALAINAPNVRSAGQASFQAGRQSDLYERAQMMRRNALAR